MTGKSIQGPLGRRGFLAIQGARLVKKKPELCNRWVPIENLRGDLIPVLNFVDVAWRYWNRRVNSYVREVSPYIKEIIGKVPHVRFRSEKDFREKILAYRVFLLASGHDRKLRRRRIRRWKIELMIEI